MLGQARLEAFPVPAQALGHLLAAPMAWTHDERVTQLRRLAELA